MNRRPFVCGNWKMNTLPREALALAVDVVRLTGRLRDVDVAIAPPFVHLAPVARKLEDGPVALCAQNLHPEAQGAFTGEVSGPMLQAVGCKHVIVGHSERRAYFGDDDAFVNRKVAAALDARLDPILCVGETRVQRERGETMQVVETQLRGGLAAIDPALMPRVTVAYEPVWAIGTGLTATPDQAQEVHAFIRGVLTDAFGGGVAEAVRLQYGGSVKPGNAGSLLAQPDIDGALVGGAALDAQAFAEIVKAASDRV